MPRAKQKPPKMGHLPSFMGNGGVVKKNSVYKKSAKLMEQERRLKLVQEAVSYRVAGYHYEEIGRIQNCDKGTAFRRVQEGLMQSAAALENDATSLRTLELERLEKMWRSCWPKAETGDLDAIDRCMRISMQRSKLQGLDINQVELVFDESAMTALAQIITQRVDPRTAALIRADMAAYATLQAPQTKQLPPGNTIEGDFEEVDDNEVL